MNIVLDYENSALTAPQSFRDAMQTAANILDAAIYDNITVTLLVGYGDWNNGAYITQRGQAVGGSLDNFLVNYSDLRPALAAAETSVVDQSVVNSLPNTSIVDNHYAFGVSSAVAKALGLMSPTASVIDGAVGFDPSIPTSLLVGAALHEFTHAMGREPSSGVTGSGVAIAAGTFDFVRYTNVGNHLYSTGGTAVPGYFSIDGGVTKLADFGQMSDSSDFLNSGVQGSSDPFNEFGNSTTIQSLTAVDKELLDAIGFNTNGTPVAIQTDGSTILVQIGANYFLDSVGSNILGSAIKFNGSAVASGQLGAWTPIGAIQVTGGYEIAFKIAGADQYIVWSTDSSGNYTGNVIGAVAGGSAALEALETTFHQDLNGDGVIGVTTTVIEASGSTSLVAVGNNFFLDNISSGTGPVLAFGGSPVTVGQLGVWAPIGVEAVSGGYEVAFKIASTGQYTVWSTDSNGNYTGSLIGTVSGSTAALEALETSFHQDLNGDGVIGVPTMMIEASGSTSLVAVGGNFDLDNISSGTGPVLKFGGSPVTAGQLGSWAPIGVEAISGGYEVAFKIASTDQYTVWSTDSNGNYTGNLIGTVSGSSAALEALETSFHQDLNGDGVIGIPPAAAAFTSLQSAGAQSTTFDGTTLVLEMPSTFTGQIIGFTGDGTLAGSDQIDLHGMNYNTIHSSLDASIGSLTVSDGTTAATLQFLGHYSSDSFHFADDGHGGTLIVGAGPASSPAESGATIGGGHDAFVFAANFGQVTIANFVPTMGSIEFNHTVFADVAAVLAATHDDTAGNAVITDVAHDTITLQHVTTAQLLANQSAFHVA